MNSLKFIVENWGAIVAIASLILSIVLGRQVNLKLAPHSPDRKNFRKLIILDAYTDMKREMHAEFKKFKRKMVAKFRSAFIEFLKQEGGVDHQHIGTHSHVILYEDRLDSLFDRTIRWAFYVSFFRNGFIDPPESPSMHEKAVYEALFRADVLGAVTSINELAVEGMRDRWCFPNLDRDKYEKSYLPQILPDLIEAGSKMLESCVYIRTDLIQRLHKRDRLISFEYTEAMWKSQWDKEPQETY